MLAAAQVACMGQQGLSQAGALSPPCPTWGVQQHNMGCSATQHGGFSNTTWGVQQHNMGGSATRPNPKETLTALELGDWVLAEIMDGVAVGP